MKPCYAIIPAAGSSQRMGQQKLLLPWPRGYSKSGQRNSHHITQAGLSSEKTSQWTVIDQVLEAWTASQVTETIVVIRRDDLALQDACQRWPITIVHPVEATRDMKGSVIVGLQSLIDRDLPTEGSRCFIAPADIPNLTSLVIDGLITATADTQTILLPRFGLTLNSSCSGHPALLPWRHAIEVFTLASHEGIDSLIKRHQYEYLLFAPELAVKDIDTPDEYQSAVTDIARANEH